MVLQILYLNHKASSIYVGQTVSVKTSKTNGTTSTESFKREDIGLTLKVKPRISTGGKVLLEIETKIEDVTNPEGANDQPDTSKKELTTSAIVNDGESVILGGYTRNIHSNTIDKVPFFGDIPLLGALFRNKSTVDDKINLVIIITPYIVPKTKDLTYIRNKLSKLKALEDDYTEKVLQQLEMKNKIKQQKNKEENLTNTHQQRVNELFGL
jgi:general secretion pathway protein D